MRALLSTLTALVLFATASLLMGYAIKPEHVSSQPSSVLCRVYGAMLHPIYLDPDIRRELVRRGDAAYTDPALIQARNNASLQGIKLGSDIMKQSGPQPYPRNSRPMGEGLTQGPGLFKRDMTSGHNHICIYDRTGDEVAITIPIAQLCPLHIN